MMIFLKVLNNSSSVWQTTTSASGMRVQSCNCSTYLKTVFSSWRWVVHAMPIVITGSSSGTGNLPLSGIRHSMSNDRIRSGTMLNFTLGSIAWISLALRSSS